MPDALMPILPCEPRRWLHQALSSATALSFPFAGYGSNGSKPYVTGRRMLDVHLVWLMEKGAFPIRIGDKTVELLPGTLMWIPPGIVHDTVVPAHVVQHAIRIALVRRGRQLGLAMPPMVVRNCGDLAPLFEQIIAAHQRHGPYREARQRGLVAALGAAVFTRAAEPASVVGGLGEDRRQRLARLVHNQRAHPSVSALARELGLTPDYFARAFRRSFGMPPRQWLLSERLAGARAALATGSAIKAVAHRFGYRDPHLFSRQFRKAFGLSPRQWRRSCDRAM
jgi:AraC-like DNA-binding protein